MMGFSRHQTIAFGILLAAVIFFLADGPGLLEIIDNPKF